MQHKNWNVVGSVVVKRYGNSPQIFKSLQDAVIYVGYDACMRVTDRPSHLFDPYYGYYNNTYYMFFDNMGMRIPAWKIKEAANNIPNKAWRFKRIYWYHRKFKFRSGPVEGISPWRRGSFYKYPRTAQEICENDFFINYDEDVKEYKIKIRKRRSRAALPTCWDDIPKARRGDGWKNYRKQQWKD